MLLVDCSAKEFCIIDDSVCEAPSYTNANSSVRPTIYPSFRDPPADVRIAFGQVTANIEK